MSKNESEVQSKENTSAASNEESVPHLIVDRFENQLTLIRDSGDPVTLKAHIIDHAEDEEDDEGSLPPMSPEEFEKAVRAVDQLGLTWTAGTTPEVKAKNPETQSSLLSDEFEKLQEQYPRLPYEVFFATSYFLTESPVYAKEAGGIENLKRKGEIAGEVIVTPEYRNAFFFRSAIKVPYLRDIDWEVVFKLHERGVKRTPGVAYGLLSLALEDPGFIGGRGGSLRTITVAVNEAIVRNLLDILTEVKSRLGIAQRQAETLNKQQLLEEQANDHAEPNPTLGP